MKTALYASAAVIALAAFGTPAAFAQSRDQIRIVGSSTVFPYSQAVSEQYAAMTGNPAPVVESTGTDGAVEIFGGGAGTEQADVVSGLSGMEDIELALLYIVWVV